MVADGTPPASVGGAEGERLRPSVERHSRRPRRPPASPTSSATRQRFSGDRVARHSQSGLEGNQAAGQRRTAVRANDEFLGEEPLRGAPRRARIARPIRTLNSIRETCCRRPPDPDTEASSSTRTSVLLDEDLDHRRRSHRLGDDDGVSVDRGRRNQTAKKHDRRAATNRRGRSRHADDLAHERMVVDHPKRHPSRWDRIVLPYRVSRRTAFAKRARPYLQPGTGSGRNW